MKFLHWGILMLLVLVVPFLLGLFPTSYMKKQHQTLTFTYVCGWFVMFSSFEVVAIPFILLKRKYISMLVVYSVVIMLLIIFSCLTGRRLLLKYIKKYSFREIYYRYNKNSHKLLTVIGWCAFWIIVGFQIFMAVAYEYYDGDDAYYMAIPVLSDKFNTMYLRDPYTGYNYNLDIRHAFAPTPLLIGWLGKVARIHPTVIAHSVLSVIWLLLMYFIYMEMSKFFFRKNKEYRSWFMTLLAIWYMFGNVSISTSETFIMTRTWQGKGLMAGVIIPCLFLCFLMFTEKEIDKGAWMLYALTAVSSMLTTSVSFMLVPTMSILALFFIKLYRNNAEKRRP